MITDDGDRSKKRLWFAKKQLDKIEIANVPAKTLELEGFTISVSRVNDIKKGRVTAPMGVVVSCSSRTSIKLSVADYWAGAFTSRVNLHVVNNMLSADLALLLRMFHAPTETAMTEAGNSIIPFKPVMLLNAFPGAGELIQNVTPVFSNHPAVPVIMPYKGGEAFWLMLSDQVFLDLNNNNIADQPKYVSQLNLMSYSSNGSNLGGRIGVDAQVNEDCSDPHSWCYLIPQKYLHQLSSTTALLICDEPISGYTNVEGKRTVYYEFSLPQGSLTPSQEEPHLIDGFTKTHTFLEDLIPTLDNQLPSVYGKMPDAFRTILLTPSGVTSCGPIGMYCFELNGVRTTLHVVDATGRNRFNTSDSPTHDYFELHPEYVKWNLFYIMKVGNVCHLINSEQFIEQFHHLFSDITTVLTPAVDYGGVDFPDYAHFASFDKLFSAMIRTCFLNPVFRDAANPSDTHMFHGHDGNVFVWTRKTGLLAFTPNGFFKVDKQYYPSGHFVAQAVPGYGAAVIPLFITPGTHSTGGLNYTVTIPAEVLNESGVKPEISYCGAPEGNHIYICICSKKNPDIDPRYVFTGTGALDMSFAAIPGEPPPKSYNIHEVKAVYIGTPFTEWIKLPAVPADAVLVYVRPVTVEPENVFLIGVVKFRTRPEPAIEEYVYDYRFASLAWTNKEGDAWKIMGLLPFDVSSADRFSACLFGNDVRVKAQIDSSPIPVNQTQMAVASYDLYA